jgi:hypothetical protein
MGGLMVWFFSLWDIGTYGNMDGWILNLNY